MAAYGLLRLFSFTAISNALNHRDLLWCYSLHTKRLKEQIVIEQKKLEKLVNKVQKSTLEINTNTIVPVAKPIGETSKLNKLRD